MLINCVLLLLNEWMNELLLLLLCCCCCCCCCWERFIRALQAKTAGPTDSQFTQVAKSRNFIQLTCDQLVLTCVWWPNGEKLASTCVRIWGSTKVNASQHKWVHWPNDMMPLPLVKDIDISYTIPYHTTPYPIFWHESVRFCSSEILHCTRFSF